MFIHLSKHELAFVIKDALIYWTIVVFNTSKKSFDVTVYKQSSLSLVIIIISLVYLDWNCEQLCTVYWNCTMYELYAVFYVCWTVIFYVGNTLDQMDKFAVSSLLNQ